MNICTDMIKCIVSQREICTDTESYLASLRATLRQSPDVILLGEMRDYETIQTAMTAAETGHLVLSSLHTTGCSQHDRAVLWMYSNLSQQRSDFHSAFHGPAGCDFPAADPRRKRTHTIPVFRGHAPRLPPSAI